MLQAKGCTFTHDLARQCQECVMRVMLVGLYQPPIRIGPLRVLHFKESTAACQLEECQ